jgi:hypothetical protein
VTEGIDFALESGGVITGRVMSGAAALYGVSVNAYSASSRLWAARGASDTGGYYTVKGLPPGRYVLATESGGAYHKADEWYNNIGLTSRVPPAAAAAVTVQLHGVTGPVNFDLGSEAIIRGTLYTNSAPGRWCHLGLYNAAGEQLSIMESEADGSYFFDSLAGGRYYIRTLWVEPFRNEWYSAAAVTGGQIAAGAIPIDVASGGVQSHKNFNLVLGGCVTGRVSDAAGRPLHGMLVIAANAAGEPLESAATDTNGQYRLEGLPSMAVKMYVRDAPAGLRPEWYSNVVMTSSSPPPQAASVNAVAGMCVGPVDFHLDEQAAEIGSSVLQGGVWSAVWNADYPRSYQVQVSSDLTAWIDAPVGSGSNEDSRLTSRASGPISYRLPGAETNKGSFFGRIRLIK